MKPVCEECQEGRHLYCIDELAHVPDGLDDPGPPICGCEHSTHETDVGKGES